MGSAEWGAAEGEGALVGDEPGLAWRSAVVHGHVAFGVIKIHLWTETGSEHADRRSWSRLCKRVFRDPPRQRKPGLMDFSGFETARGGIWRICAVIDYASKYCLATTVTPTSRSQDALACLWRAVVESTGSSTLMISAPTEA
jgi:hypothetical protein